MELSLDLLLPAARHGLLGCADLETIGKTPMVKLNNILTEEMKAAGTLLLCKLEMQNPGGSVKDRIALHMIEDAEKSGKLKPGMTVIEYTSGNTGIGIAMVCAAKGYRCIVVMPQLPSCMERYIICRQFGAEVRLTAPAKGQPGMRAYVEELLAADDNLFCTSQFNNPVNPATHIDTTGPEILEQSGGRVDYFVSGVGTGGTVTGVGTFLKEKCGTTVIAVEPTESRVNIGQAHSPHTIMGIGAGVVPPFIEAQAPGEPMSDAARGCIAEFQSASSDECIATALRMAQTEVFSSKLTVSFTQSSVHTNNTPCCWTAWTAWTAPGHDDWAFFRGRHESRVRGRCSSGGGGKDDCRSACKPWDSLHSASAVEGRESRGCCRDACATKPGQRGANRAVQLGKLHP